MSDTYRTGKVSPMDQQEDKIEEIFTALNNLEIKSATEKLSFLDEKGIKELPNLVVKGESLLHVAVNLYEENNLFSFITELIGICPSLLRKSRSDREYAGQTPLHVAIVKENTDLIKLILQHGKKRLKTRFSEILHMQAKGTKFKNTVMMGQLPLSVAALTLNSDIVEILIKYRANIGMPNKHGDTVLHSLVKYAAIHPDKMEMIKDMLKFLHKEYISENSAPTFSPKDGERNLKYEKGKIGIWFMTNNEHYTPLQLAAKLGIAELVGFILDLKDVYFFVSAYDGLFDIKMYDITEIDSLTNQQMEKEIFSEDKMIRAEGQSQKTVDNIENCCTCCGITCRIPVTKSVTEMLFTNDYENNDAFQIIQIPPVRRLIEKKWKSCLKAVMAWGILHFALMVILTVYAVLKADMNETDLQDVNNADFVWVFPWFAVIFGILYLLVVLSVISSRARRQCFSNYWMKNLQHVLLLLTYAICIFIHSGTKDNHVGDITLSIALIAGWSFFTFFLSPIRSFSFLTELLKQVILKDFASFMVIIFFEYLAFSASMYTMLRLHPEPSDNTSGLEEHYNLSFGDMLLMMFKLLIGLEDVGMVANAKVYWYAITLYIVFVLLTYILLLNALIALMSNTSALVQEQRYEHWKVQQLSVVLFLEEIIMWLPMTPLHKLTIGEVMHVTNIDLETNSLIKRRRWFLPMHYLEDSKYNTAEKYMLQKYGRSTNKDESEENQVHSKRSEPVRIKNKGTQTVDVYDLKRDGTSSLKTLTQTVDIKE